MINLMMQGRQSIRAYMKEAERYGLQTDANAKKAEELNNKLGQAKRAFNESTKELRVLIYEGLTGLLKAFNKVIEIGGKVLQVDIAAWAFGVAAAVIALSTAFNAISVAKFLVQIGSAVAAVMKLTTWLTILDVVKKYGVKGLIGLGVVAGIAGVGYLGFKAFAASKTLGDDGSAERMTANTSRMSGGGTRIIPSSQTSYRQNVINQDIKIDVSGAGDPVAVGREVSRRLKRESIFGSSNFEASIF
jgi:hypothetical protein